MRALRLLCAIAVVACSLALPLMAQAKGPDRGFPLVLTYHDIVAAGEASKYSDAVPLKDFVAQLQWLRANGYTFIHPNEYLQWSKGLRVLAPKSVLLTFDDAYRSFPERVLPLLSLYDAHALLAVVGSWHLPDDRGEVQVAGRSRKASDFMSIEQLKKAHASGRVVLASHTFALHTEVMANRWGSAIPAVVARGVSPLTSQLESVQSYRQRLREDFLRNQDFLRAITGAPAEVLVWPYGRFNGEALDAAKAAGHLLTFSLDEPQPEFSVVTPVHGRKYITANTNLTQFSDYVTSTYPRVSRYRALHIGLDAAMPGSRDVSPTLLKTLAASSFDTVVLETPLECSDSSDTIERLSRAAWTFHRLMNFRVFIDAATALRCALSTSAAEPLIELGHLFAASPFDGLYAGPSVDDLAGVPVDAVIQSFRQAQPGRVVVAPSRANADKQSVEYHCGVDSAPPPLQAWLVLSPSCAARLETVASAFHRDSYSWRLTWD